MIYLALNGTLITTLNAGNHYSALPKLGAKIIHDGCPSGVAHPN